MKTSLVPIVLVAAALLGGCGLHSSEMSPAGLLAQARQEGLPVTMSQLQAPLPPAAQNAAPLYTLLTQRLSDRPLSSDDQPADELSNNSMPSPDELSDARQALAGRSDLLSLIHQALARPQCVFQRDWTTPNPGDITFPELSTMREAARLLTGESLVMASEGKGVEAVNNEALGFRLAQHAASDHTLISSLVGMAVDAITFAGLRNIIYLSHGDPHVARAVERAIEEKWQAPTLAQSMRTEVAFQQGVITMLRRTGPVGLNTLVSGSSSAESTDLANMKPAAWQQFLDANGAYLLGLMPQVVAAADLPYQKAYPEMQQISSQVTQPQDMTHLIAVIMFPAAADMVEKRAQIRAEAAVTCAGAALLSYRAAHGAYPQKLDEALSPVPLDPFNGHPVLYRHNGPYFVVYSVGPNTDFDGGTPDERPDAKESFFRYPCPSFYAAQE